MATNRLIIDNRDVDNTKQINDTVHYYAEWAFTKLKNILGEAYPLVIRPAGKGLAGFFQGEDGNYRLYQPVADLAMIPGNAAMVLADGFAPLHPNGGIGVPTAPIFGRLYQTVQLVTDIGNSRLSGADRLKCPIAAVTAATLAVYVGLQAMSVANGLLVSNQTLAANLTLDPFVIVKNLMNGNPELYQKLIIGLAGYIGATNAFVKGKELVLNDVQGWWHGLWADVQKDHLLRHLDKLSKIDDVAAQNAEAEYHRAVASGKDWNMIDFSGRALERALLIPSRVLSLPSHNTRNITLPKAWLANNSYVKGSTDTLRLGGDYISNKTPVTIKNTASAFVNLLGWDTQKQASKPEHYPCYDDLMKQKMREYWILPYPMDSIVGFFGANKRTERERKLDLELIQRYTDDVRNNKLGLALGAPAMPYSHPMLPIADNWQKAAKANPEIQKMLNAEFPAEIRGAQLYEKARLYNEALYSVYSTGEYKPASKSKLSID